MTGSLNFPVFLYAMLAMLALGTFLTEAKYGPHTAILISGFYLAAVYLQKWFFDSDQMFRKKSRAEAVDQIIFAGKPVETEAEAALEKRTLDKVLKLPVQIKLRIGMFGMVGVCVSLVLNHTLQMHFTLFFHLITALLILPAMTPNHFILPCIVNLLAVGYGYASSEAPDVFLHSIYVLVFMFVIMSFGNVQREIRQTHAKALPVAHLTIRTLVTAVQTGVAYVLLMGIVDYFVPRPGKTKAHQKGGIKTTMVQVQAMLGRAMPDSFRPAPGASGAPNPGEKQEELGIKAQPSPDGGAQQPSGTPSQAPNAQPSPSGAPSSGPSAKPSSNPSAQPDTTPSSLPSSFPLPSTLPSLSPQQVQDLARQAIRNGLFNEEDLKRGELNLKPDVQKLLSSNRVKRVMNELKKASEQARQGQRPRYSNGHPVSPPEADPNAPETGGLQGRGLTKEEKEKLELERAMRDILKTARAALADVRGARRPGDRPSGGASLSPDEEEEVPVGAAAKAEKVSVPAGGGAGGGGESGGNDKKEADKSPVARVKQWIERIKKAVKKKDLPALVDELFTVILLAVVFGLVVYFRKKLSKKADPRRMSRAQLAREQRAEILKRLKELAAGGLSAREEVIARYDLFCRIMEFAATPRETYLPPTDFQRRVRLLHPPLDGQSKQITDVFCDVFYGDQPVGAEDVKRSRGSVKEIFHYFAD